MTDILIMPMDLAVPAVDAPDSSLDLRSAAGALVGSTHDAIAGSSSVVIVRRRCAREALLDAEKRGAPDDEIRILEEAAIAASITRVRAILRQRGSISPAQRAQFERDRELLRRFPDDRRGTAGEGWVHVPR